MTESKTSSTSSASAGGADAEDRAGFLASLPDFRKDHRRQLRAATTIVLLILAVKWVAVATHRPARLPLERGETFRQTYRIDINEANWVEWMQLEGIGISMAHRIVADREKNGHFLSIDDVARVPGIGPRRLEEIRECLTMGHDLRNAQLDSAQKFTDSRRDTRGRHPAGPGEINAFSR